MGFILTCSIIKVFTGFILTGATTLAVSVVLARVETHIQQPERRSRCIKWLAYRLAPTNVDDALRFWEKVLRHLVLGLSDQQLLTGLLLLTIALTKYWPQGQQELKRMQNIPHAGNQTTLEGLILDDDGPLQDLFYAADPAFFASITHAATIFALQDHFRKYAWVTTPRMFLTAIAFLLWAFIALYEAQLDFKAHPDRNTVVEGALEVVEFVGLLWVYWSLALSLYISDQALQTRSAISSLRRQGSYAQVRSWIEGRDSWLKQALWRIHEAYFRGHSQVLDRVVWLVAELLFPYQIRFPLLVFLFTLGLGVMVWDIEISELESAWGFGQFLPALLVVLPFYQLVQTYVGEFGCFVLLSWW